METAKAIVYATGAPHRIRMIAGGVTRFHSVSNGLKLIKEEAVIFVHDGVRCLLSTELVHNCYEQALSLGSAVPVVDARDSVRVVSEGGSLQGGEIVIATGAHDRLLRSIDPALAYSVRPVKGQILRLDQSAMPLLGHVVRTPEMYLAPKSSGWMVLGASSEDRGFDPSITAGEVLELLRAAWECVPGIYELPIVETRFGFGPTTIDHAPMLGPGGAPHLWLAMGYYRHGLLFSPYAADILARRLLDGARSQWLETFSPERFHATASERTAD